MITSSSSLRRCHQLRNSQTGNRGINRQSPSCFYPSSLEFLAETRFCPTHPLHRLSRLEGVLDISERLSGQNLALETVRGCQICANKYNIYIHGSIEIETRCSIEIEIRCSIEIEILSRFQHVLLERCWEKRCQITQMMLNNIIDDDRREIISDVMRAPRYEWYSAFMRYKNL